MITKKAQGPDLLSLKKPSSKAKIWAGAVILATLLGALVALPASAAPSRSGLEVPGHTVAQANTMSNVRSGHSCNLNPLLLVLQCTTVHGSGLKITKIDGYGYSNATGVLTRLHIEIYFAGRFRDTKLKNCDQFNLQPFPTATPTCTWDNPHPNRNVRAGNYCSRTWQNNGNGNFSILSTECIDVHR